MLFQQLTHLFPPFLFKRAPNFAALYSGGHSRVEVSHAMLNVISHFAIRLSLRRQLSRRPHRRSPFICESAPSIFDQRIYQDSFYLGSVTLVVAVHSIDAGSGRLEVFRRSKFRIGVTYGSPKKEDMCED